MLVGASAEERVWKFMDQRDEFKLFIHNKKSSGKSRGGARGAASLFVEQIEARRAEKELIWDRVPLISGSGWQQSPLHYTLFPFYKNTGCFKSSFRL